MHVHEDKAAINDTGKSRGLAAKGRSRMKKYSNKKADKFRKAQAKRG